MFGTPVPASLPTELVASSDLQHLETALRALVLYYHLGERAPGQGPLPEKVDIVRSGCIAAQLAHHPEDLDRRAGPPHSFKSASFETASELHSHARRR